MQYSVGKYSNAAAIGDLDGDGQVDLVITNGGSNDVSVLIGIGNGFFTNEVRFGVGKSNSYF